MQMQKPVWDQQHGFSVKVQEPGAESSGFMESRIRTHGQKGLRDRNSPTCTLSQNGYGAQVIHCSSTVTAESFGHRVAWEAHLTMHRFSGALMLQCAD